MDLLKLIRMQKGWKSNPRIFTNRHKCGWKLVEISVNSWTIKLRIDTYVDGHSWRLVKIRG